MPHTTSFDAPDFRAVFGELTGLYLLLSPDLRIVAASKAYLRATRQTERIIGMPVFEAFPDSGENGHGGAQALARSFERVLTHRTPDAMPLQRYDLVLADGGVEARYWSPVNTPVFDDSGQLGWILHRVFDVTAAVASGARDPRVGELEGELFHTASRLSTAYEALREGEARLRLALEWRERGGPTVRPPTRVGFGSELLSRIFRNAGGAVETTYDPGGVVCRIEVDTD